MRSRRSKTLNETVELNITAFLNLMVILVPFLLITAVFSRMTVLELTLPPLNSQAAEQEKIDLQLQMLIRPSSLELRDANLGRLQIFEIEQNTVSWKPIVDLLVQIKQRFPEETAISLLLDPAVPYSRLIEVMDHVRSTEIVNVTTLEEVELFPSIAIGKAPQQASDSEAAAVESVDALQSRIENGQNLEAPQ